MEMNEAPSKCVTKYGAHYVPLYYTFNFESPLKFCSRSVFFSRVLYRLFFLTLIPILFSTFSRLFPDFFPDFLWKVADRDLVTAVDLANVAD